MEILRLAAPFTTLIWGLLKKENTGERSKWGYWGRSDAAKP